MKLSKPEKQKWVRNTKFRRGAKWYSAQIMDVVKGLIVLIDGLSGKRVLLIDAAGDTDMAEFPLTNAKCKSFSAPEIQRCLPGSNFIRLEFNCSIVTGRLYRFNEKPNLLLQQKALLHCFIRQSASRERILTPDERIATVSGINEAGNAEGWQDSACQSSEGKGAL